MTTGRRQFLKASALSGLSLALKTKSFADFSMRKDYHLDGSLPLPSFPQMEWQDSEFGIIFHFDISIATNNITGDNEVKK
jgi:hypothetical protein